MSGMDRLTKLKSCPFCGGAASVWTTSAHSCDSAEHVIGCKECEIYMPFASVFESNTPDQPFVDAWNRRASQAAPAPVAWQHVAASIQAHQIADDVVSGRLNRLTAFVPYTALKAAPAPSDGLREAWTAGRDAAFEYMRRYRKAQAEGPEALTYDAGPYPAPPAALTPTPTQE